MPIQAELSKEGMRRSSGVGQFRRHLAETETTRGGNRPRLTAASASKLETLQAVQPSHIQAIVDKRRVGVDLFTQVRGEGVAARDERWLFGGNVEQQQLTGVGRDQ